MSTDTSSYIEGLRRQLQKQPPFSLMEQEACARWLAVADQVKQPNVDIQAVATDRGHRRERPSSTVG